MKRRDRATKILKFIGDVIVNGNPEMKGRKAPEGILAPPVCRRGYIRNKQDAPESKLRGANGRVLVVFQPKHWQRSKLNLVQDK